MATPHRPPPAGPGDARPRRGGARPLAAFGAVALVAVALAIASLDRSPEPGRGTPTVPAGIETQDPLRASAPDRAGEPGAGRAAWRDVLSRWLGGPHAAALGPLRDLVDLARDPETPLELRVGAVRWIARDGGEEAFEILEDLLRGDAPASLQAAIAEALGESPRPEARPLLQTLLESEDEAVARGALRGLALAPELHRNGPLRP